MKSGRMAEGLLLASGGGTTLWTRARDEYLRLHGDPFLKMIGNIMTNDFEKLVQVSDLANWMETLAILATYSADQYPSLCEKLAERLETEKFDIRSAVVCYICASNFPKTVSIWANMTSQGSHKLALQDLVEKMAVLQEATKFSQTDALFNAKLTQYAEILANSGRLTAAMRYLCLLRDDASSSILRDRIYNSAPQTMTHFGRPPAFPFQTLDVRIVYQPPPAAPRPGAQQGAAPHAQPAAHSGMPQQQYGNTATNHPGAPIGNRPNVGGHGGMPPTPNTGMPSMPNTGMPPMQNTGMPQRPGAGMPPMPNSAMPPTSNAGMPPRPNTGMPRTPIAGPQGAPSVGAYGAQLPPNAGMPPTSNAGMPPMPNTGMPRTPTAGPQGMPPMPGAHRNPQSPSCGQPAGLGVVPPAGPGVMPPRQGAMPGPAPSPYAAAAPPRAAAAPPPAAAAPVGTPMASHDLQTARNMFGTLLEASFQKDGNARKRDDIAKRLEELYSKLQEGRIKAATAEKLLQMVRSIEANDLASAGRIQVELSASDWDTNKNWLMGIKRLL